MGVPEDERTAAQDVVDVLATRDVAKPRAVSLADHERHLLRGVVPAQDTAGQDSHRLLEQSFFVGATAGWTCHSTSLGRRDWRVLYRKGPLAARVHCRREAPAGRHRPGKTAPPAG